MKKLRNFLVLLLSLPVLFTACKSLPAGRKVSAIELLDNNSSFYIAIPKKADTLLIERIISANVKNISQSQAKLLSDKVSKVYCGINRSRNFFEIQAALDTNLPVNQVSKLLNKKNGWKDSSFTPESSVNQYPIYSYDDIEISFPNRELTCIGRNMEDMITKYDYLSALPEDETELISDLDSELLEYLNSAEEEIRFYAGKPQSFLTILTGTQLDLRLIDVKGSFVTDPDFENQYLLNLDFRFKNDKFLKAGKTLLTLAFCLTNSQSIIIGDSELIISGIKIDKKQLYKILSL